MAIRDLFARRRRDPMQAKLELACACLDIGDKARARELLREVTSAGTPEQKKQAEELLVKAIK